MDIQFCVSPVNKLTRSRFNAPTITNPEATKSHMVKFCILDSSFLLNNPLFFCRKDGVLVFRSDSKDLYWQFIGCETIKVIAGSLEVLDQTGYQFKSITIDGRKGVIQLLRDVILICLSNYANFIKRKLYTAVQPIHLKQNVDKH